MKAAAIVIGTAILAVALLGTYWATNKQNARNVTQEGAGAPNEQTTPVAQPVQSPPAKILTKCDEYARLLKPQSGDEYLQTYSGTYARKKQEIEAKVAPISDPELRERARADEWSKVNKYAFTEEADATVHAALLACLRKHRGDWFEVGHVEYPATGELTITSVDASPLSLSPDLNIPMDVVAMDGVYSKFHAIVAPDINATIQSEESDMRNHPEAIEGSGFTVEQWVSDKHAENLKDIEEKLRQSRLVLVAQGDIVSHRIDRLMLVDYGTENILLELNPKVVKSGEVKWKYSETATPEPTNDQPSDNS